MNAKKLGIDAELMLKLERLPRAGYAHAADVVMLFEEWEHEFLGRLPEADQAHREQLIRRYGIPFLFECGRVHGIQQERARRRKHRTR